MSYQASNKQAKIYSVFIPTIIIAIILDLILFPQFLELWRPRFVALCLIFFASFNPRRINIEIAALIGFIYDLLVSAPLGAYAFIYATQVFIIVFYFKRFYTYKIYQQIVLVVLIHLISNALGYWLLHLIGVRNYESSFLQQGVGVAIFWPLIMLLLAFLMQFFNLKSHLDKHGSK